MHSGRADRQASSGDDGPGVEGLGAGDGEPEPRLEAGIRFLWGAKRHPAVGRAFGTAPKA